MKMDPQCSGRLAAAVACASSAKGIVDGTELRILCALLFWPVSELRRNTMGQSVDPLKVEEPK